MEDISQKIEKPKLPLTSLGQSALGRDVRFEKVGVEQAGTFDAKDILRMAEEGLLVIPIGFGQAVFREVNR